MRARLLTSTPREAALAILEAWFGPRSDTPPGVVSELLAKHQLSAAHRLEAILAQARIAILADSVGVGKTHTAIALIERELTRGGDTLVIAPAALRSHWQRHLRELLGASAERCAITTHTALSFGRLPSKSPALVVVDEAHQFRNPRTRRYRSLSSLVRDARTLLLTATPINNSVEDLYHLIRLGASDRAFVHLGVADLRAAFKNAMRDPVAMRDVERVLHHVVVRRSREHIVSSGGADTNVRFPRRLPVESIRYELGSSRALQLIELLRFPLLSASQVAGARLAAELLRLQLLKRLESGAIAFEKTVHRCLRITESAITALDAGQTPTIAQLRSLLDHDVAQLSFMPLLSASNTPIDASQMRAGIVDELEVLTQLHGMARTTTQNDPKLRRFEAWLRGAIAAHEKVLVFTQFRDTAVQLWRQLRASVPTGMVCGETAWLGSQRAGRGTVVECFAPLANRANVHGRMRVDLLISTDVLAEGMNLQDAGIVVSYDIPWNPVTMMQRAGRIDRLGSPHESVRSVVVLPDRDLDHLLGLVDRVEHKIRAIARTVGIDAPVLGVPDASTCHTPGSLSGPPNPIQLASLEQAERLRTLWKSAQPTESTHLPRVAVLPSEFDATLIAVRQSSLRLIVRRDGRVKEDPVAAGAILIAALDSDHRGSAALDLEDVFRWIESAHHAGRLGSATARGSPGSAVLTWLYEAIQTNPPDDALISRADRICRTLRRADHNASDWDLAAFLRSLPPAPPLDAALRRLEQILAADAPPAEPLSPTEIVGIIQAFKTP